MAGLVWHNRRMTKRCADCARELPLTAFTRSGRYRRSYCRDCSNARSRRYGAENRPKRNARLRQWRAANPDAARAKDHRARLMRKYRMTPEQVEAMRVAQGGRCLLCGTSTRLLVLDHDHRDGGVRGLLCRSCNTIVGQIEQAPAMLDRLADYVHGVHPGLASSNSTSA